MTNQLSKPQKCCFRLFDLPHVILRAMIQTFDVVDLLDLSMCSTKSKSILRRTLRRKLKIDVKVDEKCKQFRFFTKNDNYCGEWNFATEQFFGGEKEEFRCIEGYKFRFEKLFFLARSNYPRPDITMYLVLRKLRELFDCHVINFDISQRGSRSMITYLLAVHICENFCYQSRLIPNDDLKFILEVLKVENKFQLNANNFHFPSKQSSLSARSICLIRCFWLSEEGFLGADCETMFLTCCRFSSHTYELFVSRWLAGSYRKLRHVRVDARIRIHLEVLESRGSSWDPEQRGRFFLINDKKAIDCSEGVDILRSDGTLATFITGAKKFQMYVWHERFPELTEQHQIN